MNVEASIISVMMIYIIIMIVSVIVNKLTLIFIVKNDDKISEARQLKSVLALRKFMNDNKLHSVIVNDVEDRRLLLDVNNKAIYKLFEYDNDKHEDTKRYMKNKKAIASNFDDLNQKIIEDKIITKK
jgi:flagellar biogenesis protein FliO